MCTRAVKSLRRSFSCNTFVTNVEVWDTDFLDALTCYFTSAGSFAVAPATSLFEEDDERRVFLKTVYIRNEENVTDLYRLF